MNRVCRKGAIVVCAVAFVVSGCGEFEDSADTATTVRTMGPFYSGATQEYPLSLFQTPVVELGALPTGLQLPVVTAIVDVSNPSASLDPPTAAEVRDLLFTAPDSPAAWFLENSLGTAQLVDAGVFNVTLPQDGSYYWGNRHQEREVDAIRQLETLVDFAQYSGTDTTIGNQELVVIVWTPEEGRLLGLARKTGDVDGSTLKVDGVDLKTNSLELFIDDRSNPAAIAGLLSHEISHLVGTADLYGRECAFEFDGREHEMAGHLSMLDDLSEVTHIDAYHRLKLGWFNSATVIEASGTYTLGENADLMVIPAPNSDYAGDGIVDLEYFLLEYRPGFGSLDWPAVPGLAVWRIHEQTGNMDACWSRRAVSLVRADPIPFASGGFNDQRALFDPNDPTRAGPMQSDSPTGLALRRTDQAGQVVLRASGISISNLAWTNDGLSLDVAYEPAVVLFPEIPPLDLEDHVPPGDVPEP